MKRILSLILIFISITSFIGCNNREKDVSKTPITVNMPKDDNVNGYKKNNNPDIEINNNKITVSESTETYIYFGNGNSKKFHKVSCSSYKNTKDENKVFYKTRDEFINKDYSPCKMCNP